MPQCPDCGRDLPALQTLCSQCYEARYADVGRPKSFLESLRESRWNPRRQQVNEERIQARPWLPWFFALIGLLLDWRCSFEWFAGKSSCFSADVLGRAALIVLACGAISVFAMCVTAKARWQHALALFTVLSVSLYRLMNHHWIVTR